MMKTPQGTAYEIHGKGQPETLILIHGLGLTRRTWDDFIPALCIGISSVIAMICLAMVRVTCRQNTKPYAFWQS